MYLTYYNECRILFSTLLSLFIFVFNPVEILCVLSEFQMLVSLVFMIRAFSEHRRRVGRPLLICELPGSCCGPKTSYTLWFCFVKQSLLIPRIVRYTEIQFCCWKPVLHSQGAHPFVLLHFWLMNNHWDESPHMVMLLSWKECTMNVMYKEAGRSSSCELDFHHHAQAMIISLRIENDVLRLCARPGVGNIRSAASFYRDRQRCMNVWSRLMYFL
jgi:hypothetical protein